MFRLKKDKSSPGGVPQLETRISSPGKRYRAKALTKEEVRLLLSYVYFVMRECVGLVVVVVVVVRGQSPCFRTLLIRTDICTYL